MKDAKSGMSHIFMLSKATTPEQYLKELPADRKEAVNKLRDTIPVQVDCRVGEENDSERSDRCL